MLWWEMVAVSLSILILTILVAVPSANTTLNQSPTTLDMSRPFRCDAQFLWFLDRRRCVLRFVIALVIGSVASGVTAASAQTYPQRAVKFILPFGPAAGTDITARLLGEKLAARWGKPVVIENRPGGDGLVAINAFISANDEHTLLFVPASTFTAHPYAHEKLPYDAERDLLPITNVTTIVIALSAPTSLNVRTLGEFIALARAKPIRSTCRPPPAIPT